MKSNGLRRFFLKFFFDASARGEFFGPRGVWRVFAQMVFGYAQMVVLGFTQIAQINQFFLDLWMVSFAFDDALEVGTWHATSA